MSLPTELLEDRWRQLAERSDGNNRGVSMALPTVTAHGPMRLGFGGAHRQLLAPIPASARRTLKPDHQSLGAHIDLMAVTIDDETRWYSVLSCEDDRFEPIFSLMCTLILSRIELEPTRAAWIMRRMLKDWRSLLNAAPSPMSKGEIIGAWGELYVLSRLCDHYDEVVSLWKGPNGSPQDFVLGRSAIEVKTSTSEHARVAVHGLEQLEPAPDGRLTIAFIRIIPADDGRTLADLVAQLLDHVDDTTAFRMLLQSIGYQTEVASEDRYALVEERWFAVDSDFPRITPSTLRDGASRTGITGVEYTVDLDVPVPLSSPDQGLERFFS